MSYRLAVKSYRLPLRTPLRTAHGLWTEREGLMLRLEAADGRVGFGEVAPLPWFGTETLAEAVEVVRALGDQPGDAELETVPARFGCVQFGLAMARAGEPPAAEAGGRLAVAALLPAGREARAALARRLEEGFLAFKWKVGVGTVDDELAMLDDLLAELPGYGRLRVDANGGWNRRQAARWLERCAERPVEFVEQPLPAEDRDGLLGLARDFPVTLALDEAVAGLDVARRWQGLGWPGVFVIKPALAGPLAEIEEWTRVTRADVVWSSAIETVVGRRAILRWAVTTGLTKRAVGFGVGDVFAADAWNGPALGALADAGWAGATDMEALWSALN